MTRFRLQSFLGPEQPSGKLAIFDKDGTLINFHAMWATWIQEVVRRIEVAAEMPLAEHLYTVLGYEPRTNRILPALPLALAPVNEMHEIVVAALREAGLSEARAWQCLETAWFAPDPVATAVPLADLHELFGMLRARGLRVAVATADDHDPAVATLAGLGVLDLVDMVVGADDMPTKPAPDPVLAICAHLNIAPADAMVVGDSRVDLQMGRAAGAGLLVGVASGLYAAEELAPEADVVLDSIADLLLM